MLKNTYSSKVIKIIKCAMCGKETPSKPGGKIYCLKCSNEKQKERNETRKVLNGIVIGGVKFIVKKSKKIKAKINLNPSEEESIQELDKLSGI